MPAVGRIRFLGIDSTAHNRTIGTTTVSVPGGK